MSVFFIETATTEIYTYVHTLSLHGALPILSKQGDNYDGTGSAPVDASLFGGGLVPLPGFGIFGNGKYNWLLWALIAAGLLLVVSGGGKRGRVACRGLGWWHSVRSDGRRVGTACVRTCRSRGSAYH